MNWYQSEYSVEMEYFQIKEFLNIVSNTLVFLRVPVSVTPLERNSELFDVAFISTNNNVINDRIENRIKKCGKKDKVQETHQISANDPDKHQINAR